MRRTLFTACRLAVVPCASVLAVAACSEGAGDAEDPIFTPETNQLDAQAPDADANVAQRPRRDASWLGGEDEEPPPPPGPPPEFASFASTWSNACAIGVDGSLWCWGNGYYFTLGQGLDRSVSLVPKRVGRASDWATLAVAEMAVCATKTNGSLWCWGSDLRALGIGGAVAITVPQQTGSDFDWKLVRIEAERGCGVKTNGELWCWGTALRRVGAARWKALALHAEDTTCGIQVDGSLWCWGNGLYLPGYIDQPSPMRIGTDSDWVDLQAGSRHFCALREDQSLWCWGHSASGKLGATGLPPYVHEPREVLPDTTWASVLPGDHFTCAVDTDAALWCWGASGTGLPTRVGTESDWSFYSGTSARRTGLCAKRADGSRWCWGENGGTFGDGKTENYTVPTLVP